MMNADKHSVILGSTIMAESYLGAVSLVSQNVPTANKLRMAHFKHLFFGYKRSTADTKMDDYELGRAIQQNLFLREIRVKLVLVPKQFWADLAFGLSNNPRIEEVYLERVTLEVSSTPFSFGSIFSSMPKLRQISVNGASDSLLAGALDDPWNIPVPILTLESCTMNSLKTVQNLGILSFGGRLIQLNLTSIQFSNSKLMMCVLRSLALNPQLDNIALIESIRLDACGFGDKEAIMFYSSLACNERPSMSPTISLLLDNNDFSDVGAFALSRLIGSKLSCFAELSISGNKLITSLGVRFIMWGTVSSLALGKLNVCGIGKYLQEPFFKFSVLQSCLTVLRLSLASFGPYQSFQDFERSLEGKPGFNLQT